MPGWSSTGVAFVVGSGTSPTSTTVIGTRSDDFDCASSDKRGGSCLPLPCSTASVGRCEPLVAAGVGGGVSSASRPWSIPTSANWRSVLALSSTPGSVSKPSTISCDEFFICSRHHSLRVARLLHVASMQHRKQPWTCSCVLVHAGTLLRRQPDRRQCAAWLAEQSAGAVSSPRRQASIAVVACTTVLTAGEFGAMPCCSCNIRSHEG